jgi:hypothetical protein
MSSNTVISIPYSGTNQTANVTSTYGVPVTAHIWGAGGGSTSLYPGAGGGYSRVNFITSPGDTIEVIVGQGGGAGGVTQPPPVPPTTWTTRSADCDTTLYTGFQFNQAFYVVPVQLINTYGVWNTPSGIGTNGQTQVWTWASVYFPVSGYYTIQGSSYANTNTISIDGVAVLSDSQGNLYPVQARVYVAAGYHSISISTTYYDRRQRTPASVAYTINQANPPRIPNTPAGIAGAAYIALMFNTRFPPAGQAPVYAYGNGDSFLDQWGVWGADQTELSFVREYSISFIKPYAVTFQMSSSNAATLAFNGSTVITRTAADNPNTPTEYRANFAIGTYTLSISATGTSGALNRVGVILSNPSQTSFSGGRGGISDPTSTQGFGGGGGGATVLAVNGKFIGVGAGGGGGASAAPTNLNYITTKYTGSTATQPFPGLGPVPGPVVIVPGSSGYYVKQLYTYNDVGNLLHLDLTGWCIVVNGTIVYGPSVTAPPESLAVQKELVGYSYIGGSPGPSTSYEAVACYNFNYISLASDAITDARYNGQNGQDVFNFNTTDTGGGGGGGGGSRGGNGGAGRGSGGGGFSGHNGLSLGDITVPTTGRLPYINSFYPGGGVAEGGNSGTAVQGGNGFVALEFQTGAGAFVKDGGEWKLIQTIYFNDQGVWKEAQPTFVNDAGIWKPVKGGIVPEFSSVDGLFGAWVRTYSAGSLLAPPPPAPVYTDIGSSYSGGDGYGGADSGSGDSGDGG